MKKEKTQNSSKDQTALAESNPSLITIIETAIKIPGVRVSRHDFLHKQFEKCPKDVLDNILENGPVAAGCSEEDLRKKATKLINDRTLFSTAASFLSGLPGGLAMAATIPADMLQYYAVSLRLAQEIAYLYGESDFWIEDGLDESKVKNQLVLYCGVMLGASGAAQAIRVLAASLGKQAMKKLPQKALTKTFIYPIVKSIVKTFGGKMTKTIFANGISKAIPVVGGVVAGGLTFVSMRPMGTRLMNALDKANFDYTEEDLQNDMQDIQAENEKMQSEEKTENPST